MKKLVTSLFLLTGIAVSADGGYAQQVVSADRPTVKDRPAHILSFDKRLAHPMSPMAAPDVTELNYVSPDVAVEDLVQWSMPRLINYTESSDTVVMFMSRMTNPFPEDVLYLDSVSALVLANRVVESPNNNLRFHVWYAQQPDENGVIWPSKAAGGSKTIAASKLMGGEPEEIGVHFRSSASPTAMRRKLDFNTTWTNQSTGETLPVHPTDFFVGIETTFFDDLVFDPENENNEQNDIAVLGDAFEDVEEFDAEAHRGFAWGQRTWLLWRLQSSDGTNFFSNFAIKAFVSDQPRLVITGDVADDVTSFAMRQNYPNPFVGNTQINYSVNETTPVSIKVFNTMGVEVASLVNEVKAQGSYVANFDASNLPSGNYMYTMTAGGETITKAMTVAK